ncbi:hypothetical protein COJ03_27180 [Bacillus cereus]|uniref:hypothetical protein n=1 Tax=Bacillus cereus TaxID=1396 RepID=UPI000BF6B15A|nr:hypothetical protein [Bacillus cereus]PFK17894.1 hypothetical protein COJ03_27180 [Bacillus cereus]
MKNKAVSFSVPESLFNEFSDYCKSNNLNKSAIIRGFIYLYLKEKTSNSSVVSQVIENKNGGNSSWKSGE